MAIFNNHHELATAFGIIGNIISFCVFLAPVPTFYRICKKRSTESFQSLPYLVALFSSMLWLYYALIKTNTFLLITINSFGVVIETIYIVLFLIFAAKNTRKSTLKVLGAMNIGGFSLILLLSHFAVSGNNRIIVLGWVCVAFSVSVFAAPLSIVAQVIRTKSVEFMPFSLSFTLTLSAIMWFFYGLFQQDICIALPNVVGFVLGLLQMLLYGLYRNANKVVVVNVVNVPDDKKVPENLKQIVVLSTLGGACEVYPVPVVVDIQPEDCDAKSKDVNENAAAIELEAEKKPEQKNLEAIKDTAENIECPV